MSIPSTTGTSQRPATEAERKAEARLSVEETPSVLSGLHGLFLLLAVVGSALLGLWQLVPPDTVTAGASGAQFASARAMAHVRAMARAPHPIGSAENDRVREYILAQVREMGLEPAVQEATAVNSEFFPRIAGRVRNVLARLPGAGGAGQAVLLAAHYDSVPTAPGASDDAAGVAALLETLRVLGSSARLRNDVVFLFSDGEEPGWLGATAFVEGHPWARDVRVTINLEARGNSGPSVMEGVTLPNGALVHAFADAAPHPVVSSATDEVSRLLLGSFHNDMYAFRAAGISGLGFSYFAGAPHYHTMLDTPEALSERSLQHQGSNALSLARRFGDADLSGFGTGGTGGTGRSGGNGEDLVYFNALGPLVVHYPVGWVLPLAVLIALLYVGIVLWGFRLGRITPKGALWGALGFLACVVAVPLLVWLLWSGLDLLLGDRIIYLGSTRGVYGNGLFLLGFCGLAIAFFAFAYALLLRRLGVRDLAAGALGLWTLGLMAVSYLASGASYLFTWPFLASTLGLLALLVLPSQGRARAAWVAALCVSVAPPLLLLSPAVVLLGLALTMSSVVIVVAVLSVSLGALVPQLASIGPSGARRAAALSGLAALAVLLVAIVGAESGAEHPRPNSLFYYLDADTGRAVWGSFDRRPDSWTGRYLPPGARPAELTGFFASPLSTLQGPAPAAAIAPPEVRVLSDTRAGDTRALRLRVLSPRGASVLSIYVEEDKVEVVSAKVEGRPVAAIEAAEARSTSKWALDYWAPPEAGFELELSVRGEAPVRLRAVDRSDWSPHQSQGIGVDYVPRPASMMPSPSGQLVLGGVAPLFVSRTFDLR